MGQTLETTAEELASVVKLAKEKNRNLSYSVSFQVALGDAEQEAAAGFTDFIDLVIPESQKRGSFRTAYEGTTLRENLGLQEVRSRYTLQRV